MIDVPKMFAKKSWFVLPGLGTLLLVAAPFALAADRGQPIHNGGFEAAVPADSWQVESPEGEKAFSITPEKIEVKEGRQSLLISAGQPVRLTLRQQVFLPVGTLWRL